MSKYTDERRQIIHEAIRKGLPDKDAAALADITPKTFYAWRNKHPEFRADIDRLRVEGKAELVKAIASQRFKDWRAAAWLLSHRWPEDFSERRVLAMESSERVESPFERIVSILDGEDAEEPDAG